MALFIFISPPFDETRCEAKEMFYENYMTLKLCLCYLIVNLVNVMNSIRFPPPPQRAKKFKLILEDIIMMKYNSALA